MLDDWRGPLIGLLAAWGLSWAEARDLAADVFAEAWLARSRFEGDLRDDRRVGAWLRGIARNLFLAARRERERGTSTAHAQALLDRPVELPEPDERVARLRQALDALEPELRTALYVRYVEESPLGTVAALLGISERAAEGRLYRGRKQLKESIERPVRAKDVRR